MNKAVNMKYKKMYVAPAVEMVVVATEGMLATSPGNGIIIGGGDDKVDSETDQLSARQRGEWGNLWK